MWLHSTPFIKKKDWHLQTFLCILFHLSVEVYQVTVHTGDRWAAHTNATVWVNLHGDQGDTGKRILYHSSIEGTMFMKDKKDVFNVEAVSLGMLKMVEIGHDGIGYGKSCDYLKNSI